MKLNRIEIEGYKSLKALSLDLKPLNILIGANGAGKSNFISVIKLLNELIKENLQGFVQSEGGANAMLHFGVKETKRVRLFLEFGLNGYECVLVPTIDDRLMIQEETVFFHDKTKYEKPYIVEIASSAFETALNRSSEQIASYVRQHFRTWRVYHFHDTSPTAYVKRPGDLNDNQSLRPDAANLAAFLYRLKTTDIAAYQNIRNTVRLIAPFFDDFALRPNPLNENIIRLEWVAKGSDYPFQAYHLSDGTLRFICLATLLLQPPHLMPSTIIIDEPELGLHPYAITLLASLLQSVSAVGQVIVSTQSVSLVSCFSPDDVIVVNRRNDTSEFERLNEAKLSEWLQEYSLGELWEKNIIGGRPQP